jgi:hypothetical protein
VLSQYLPVGVDIFPFQRTNESVSQELMCAAFLLLSFKRSSSIYQLWDQE